MHEDQSSRSRRATVIGALFIVATVAAGLSQVAIGSVLDDPADLADIAAHENELRIGALLDLVTAAAVAAIPVMLYPILVLDRVTTAVGYLAARVLEAAIILVGAISLLTLLALGQNALDAGAVTAPATQTLGDLLLEVRDLTDLVGTQIVFAVTALILNASFHRTRIVPRLISVWGLIGAPLALAAGILGLFGLSPFSTLSVALFLPIAVNEMVLAVWLIAKGFDLAAVESGAQGGAMGGA